MSDQVSGEAAINLAFLAFENGKKSVSSQPERLRLQAAKGIPVDILIHGAVTAKTLRQIARLLIVNAEVLEDTLEAPPPLTADGHDGIDGSAS